MMSTETNISKIINKQDFRAIVKSLRKISENYLEEDYIENALDGSGDCANAIHYSLISKYKPKVEDIFKKYDITFNDFRRNIIPWVNKEHKCHPYNHVSESLLISTYIILEEF